MQYRFLFLFLICCSTFGYSQIGTNQWRMHLSSQSCFDVALGNGLVLGALETGIIEYDIELGEKKILNRVDQLSDINVSALAFDSSSNSFFIGYKNGNIDQYLENGSIINIPAIKLAQIIGNKEILQFKSKNGLMYASTPFGIVVINISKSEIKDTYYPNGGTGSILRTTFLHDSIFCLSNNRVYKAALSNSLLADQSQWQTDPRVPLPITGSYSELDTYGDSLLLVWKIPFNGDSIMRIHGNSFQSAYCNSCLWDIGSLRVFKNDLFFNTFGALSHFTGSQNVYNAVNYNSTVSNIKAGVFYDGVYYLADIDTGLVRYGDQFSFSFLQVPGPARNEFFSVNSFNDKIAVASTTLDAVVLEEGISGGYLFQNEEWTHISNSQPLLLGTLNRALSNVAINPLNKDEVYFSSYSIDPLVRVVGDEVTELLNPANSALDFTSLGNNRVCISDVEFDDKGNLWVLNAYTNNPLKMRKPDGTWLEFETGSSSKNTYVSNLAIDYNGNVWFSIKNIGIIGLNYKNTLDNISDDIFKILQKGTGLGNLPSGVVSAIGIDFDNEIWIGTDEGFAILYNSAGLFDEQGVSDASEILINFEGNVEAFLNNTAINDIEIDGGNRKWIATASSGLYCLSADGQTIVANYTAENSPLLSNAIVDMDFNHQSGELFIVTSVGLVSLRTDASYEDPEYASTTVFPNPVKPEYAGPITIQGIRYNSDVKITDVAGNLVFQTISNGGTAIWNGKTLDGNDVPGGVYLIWTATNEKFTGKNKQVGKVVVIR